MFGKVSPYSHRNQSIDLESQSTDWFLYGRDLRHERVNFCEWVTPWVTRSPAFLGIWNYAGNLLQFDSSLKFRWQHRKFSCQHFFCFRESVGILFFVKMVSPGLEPGTSRVWSERDNHYTTKPDELHKLIILEFSSYEIRDVTADIIEVC